jgi:exopolysaccharide biosynthesis predicted pyruvyltransferase EpsI
MAAILPITPRLTDEREVLFFMREDHEASRESPDKDLGAIARFYRFVYPNLAVDARPQAEWLEDLIRRNSWLS